ncbi:plastocyanin [mine drainage metagenome]|uniref:Plastocyanin n=1 Tax=mine drainage metagenome TaxID=410659 RepID=A0A1J5PZI2_9ZZZZ
MKKMISTILLGAMPLLASAAANHDHDHDGQAPVPVQGQSSVQQQNPVQGQATMQDQGMMDMPMMGNHGMEGMHGDDHDAAAGQPGDPAKVTNTVDITMDDAMRFTPDTIHVKAGQTVRFFLKNTGNMEHEMVIGSMAELKEHEKMMRMMPDMSMDHAEPNMASLAPGQEGGMVWKFDKAGTVDFACLMPGHMEAGMVGKVVVE